MSLSGCAAAEMATLRATPIKYNLYSHCSTQHSPHKQLFLHLRHMNATLILNFRSNPVNIAALKYHDSSCICEELSLCLSSRCACLEIIDPVLSGRAWREWQVCGDGDKSAQEKAKTASYHFLLPTPPSRLSPLHWRVPIRLPLWSISIYCIRELKTSQILIGSFIAELLENEGLCVTAAPK